MIFSKILKFHDISMTGKAATTFPGFQGFPGAVGTLNISLLILLFNVIVIYVMPSNYIFHTPESIHHVLQKHIPYSGNVRWIICFLS